jgi:AraC-like DNA-binding protein
MNITPVHRVATVDALEALDALFPERGHLDIQPTSDAFRASVRSATLGQLVLVNAEFRDAVVHSRWRPHFGAHIHVSGTVRYERSGQPDATGGVLTIAPDTETTVNYEGLGHVLVVVAPPSLVESSAKRVLGTRKLTSLDRTLSGREATAGVFSRHARFVWNELARGDLRRAPVALAETEHALLARIGSLLAPQNESSASLPNERVVRAQEFIADNLERPIRAADIADAAGVSGPTLAREFRRHLGTSPVAYARGCRLDRAYQHLTGADRRETSVASVATRWGFTHLGEFAAAYARRFGERPSETLRR